MIQIDISKCTGCRRCEAACSFFHTGKINSHLARIKITHLYEIGVDGPVLCIQCKEQYCNRCPEDAISIGPLGQVIVSPTLCTLCGVCEKACPIGAIEIFNEIVTVCDLCGGKPRCVEACTEGAITYNPNGGKPLSLAQSKKETRGMNTSQKRNLFIKKQGLKLREKWRTRHA
jgi:carbon-monoxide dehydrogenase iron sulfur subunit